MNTRTVWIAAILLAAPVCRETALPEMHTIRIRVTDENDEPAEAAFHVYEDEECTIPLQDEEGEAVILESGEDGIAELVTAHSCITLRMEEPVPGYYAVCCTLDTAEKETAEEVIRLRPLVIEFKADGPPDREVPGIRFLILDEEEVIAEWDNTEAFTDSRILVAGRTYTVKAAQLPEFWQITDTAFTVPLYETEEDPVTTVPCVPYGRLAVVYSGAECPEEATYAVYEDEACETPAEDIHGDPVTLNMSDLKGADLFFGEYYLRQESIGEEWYCRKDAQKVVIKEQEELRAEIREDPVRLLLQAEADVTAIVAGDRGTQETRALSAGVPAEVRAKRGETLRITTERVPGYFDTMPMAAVMADERPEDEVCTIPMRPFAVTVSVCRPDSTYLAGADIRISDENGREAGRITSGNGPVQAEGLLCGTTYTFAVTQNADSHYPGRAKEIYIPEVYLAEKGDSFSADLVVYPYAQVRAEARDAQTEEMVGGLSGQLYTDASCTMEARDIYGDRAVLGTDPVCLDPGVYYFDPEGIPAAYYRNEEAAAVTVSGSGPLTEVIRLEPVQVLTEVRDEESGEALAGAIVQILDPGSGQILCQSAVKEGETAMGNGVLERGKTYLLRQISAREHWLRDTKDHPFTVPQHRSESEPVTLSNRHYTIVSMHTECVLNRCSDIYELTDEDGNTASDIYHRPAVFHLTDSSEAFLHMTSGRYVLKQAGWTAGTYPDREETAVEIRDEDYIDLGREQVLTILQIAVKGEDGKDVHGIAAEVRGEGGNRIDAWTTDGRAHAISGIPAGEACTVTLKDLPEGMTTDPVSRTVTMPAEEPEEIPLVTFTVRKQEKKTVLPVPEIPAEVPGTLPWGIFTGAGSILLMGVRFWLRRSGRM